MTDQFATMVAAEGDDDRLRVILEEVCQITGMGFAAIARVTDERWIACQVLDRIEFGLDPGDELKVQTTICDDIRKCGNAVVIDNVAENFNWRTHPAPALYGFKSYISLPVVLGNSVFYGTLCAIDPAPRRVDTPAIIAALETLADAVGQILWMRGAGTISTTADLHFVNPTGAGTTAAT